MLNSLRSPTNNANVNPISAVNNNKPQHHSNSNLLNSLNLSSSNHNNSSAGGGVNLSASNKIELDEPFNNTFSNFNPRDKMTKEELSTSQGQSKIFKEDELNSSLISISNFLDSEVNEITELEFLLKKLKNIDDLKLPFSLQESPSNKIQSQTMTPNFTQGGFNYNSFNQSSSNHQHNLSSNSAKLGHTHSNSNSTVNSTKNNHNHTGSNSSSNQPSKNNSEFLKKKYQMLNSVTIDLINNTSSGGASVMVDRSKSKKK